MYLALLGRYYGSPYLEDDSSNVAKRNRLIAGARIRKNDDGEENELSRYSEEIRHSPSSYLDLLRAVEEELALEAMARDESGPQGNKIPFVNCLTNNRASIYFY